MASAASVPHALSIGGDLMNADGQPVTAANVTFRIEVRDAAEQCVLYAETHANQNLSVTNGRFNLVIGGGTGAVNNLTGTTSFGAAVFVNHGATNVANCATPTVNLASGDDRAILISYDIGAGFVSLSPGIPVVAAAYALVAETLDGHGAADFLQVNATGSSGLNQTNTEYAFSGLNWPRLKALLDGTSAQYFGASPSQPIDFNSQRAINVATPTLGQDATNKNYVDQNIGGRPLDVTAVGPMVGNGSTLLWDATANRWVAGVLNTSATGTAGGDLAGTYPAPTLRNDIVTAAKIKSTGGGTNRLLMTDASTGATIEFGACALNEVYAWAANGWVCTSLATASPVTSVAGKTGAVTLNAADVSGFGTAALQDYGTAANQVPRLLAGGALPILDGTNLYNVDATRVRGRTIASTAPSAGQVLGWNNASSAWEPLSLSPTGVTNVTAGIGLRGGSVTTSGTFDVDVGTGALQIVRQNGTAQIAQAFGSEANPSYAFAGATGTGVYSPGAGALNLATNGTAHFGIDGNGHVGIGDLRSASGVHLDDAVIRTDNAAGWTPTNYVATYYDPPVGTGTAAQVIAHYVATELRGGADVQEIIASSADVTNNGSGSVGRMIGLQSVPFLNSGHADSVIGVAVFAQFNGGTTNEFRGVNIESYVNSGTLPSAYGVFINDLSGTTSYGVYQSGVDDMNYFAGAVGIGTDFPQAALDVRGHLANSDPGVPAVSACGGGSIDSTSNDARGRVTRGTAGTTCTITFNAAYATAPFCTVSQFGATTAGAAAVNSASTTQLVLRWASSQANVSFNYFCMQ